MNDLEKQVVHISYEEKIGHLSSNLNAVNIIDEIYNLKGANDVFILSSGHAALALYVVLGLGYITGCSSTWGAVGVELIVGGVGCD